MINARPSLDPRWVYRHRSVPFGFMSVPVTITRREEGPPVWNPETGTLEGSSVFVWQGPARIQPNKDWRVRYVESGTDPQLIHVVRIQIPLEPHNMPPLIKAADVITIDEPGEDDVDWLVDPELAKWRFLVRNMLNSSNPWLRNLSTMADLSDPQGEIG